MRLRGSDPRTVLRLAERIEFGLHDADEHWKEAFQGYSCDNATLLMCS